MVSVTSRIVFVLNRLYESGKARYRDFFTPSEDPSEIVATFLAILELMKSKRITVDDDNTYVYFNRNAGVAAEDFNEADYR